MESALRVELRPRTAAAGSATQAARVGAVERLANLGQIDPAEGAINVEETVGWTARIGDLEFPVAAFTIGQAESGVPVLSLVLLPGSLSIGDPSTGATTLPVRPSAPQVVSWGGDVQPEKLSEQVAGHAESRAHDRSVDLRTVAGRNIARLA